MNFIFRVTISVSIVRVYYYRIANCQRSSRITILSIALVLARIPLETKRNKTRVDFTIVFLVFNMLINLQIGFL